MSLPSVPAGLSAQLTYWLGLLRNTVNTLAAQAGIDEGSTTGDGNTPGTGLEFLPTYDTEATLADQGTGTEGAWTTVSAGAPADARYAMIQFEVESTADADIGELFWRTDSTFPTVRAVFVSGDQDDAQPRIMYFVPLTATGTFDYEFINTSGTTINWIIRYQGYVL